MAALGAKQFRNPKAAYFQLPGGGPAQTKKAASEAPSPQSEGTSASADAGGKQGETFLVAEGVARDEAGSSVGDTGPVVDAESASS